ncbi:hypothetical protein D0962_02495 [Leptolyngbyaceae cyanobacterium CCMR0082]|uniref:Uncharacterized protein n=1 Tax=Adonisia turfae CCMR0082 TaxID=2304604 RepID=A0A6M0RZN1_9CYAN|nr:hypothetical protein [Adonisia turfae]MDV3352210.1 hypothetical protein [Leptothoe sp. LEGE 181152]NEZ61655.1 hypothetical protein [Adonisia turfae CCMR0082]
MKLAELSQQQKQLLQQYKERGGVIDWVAMELEEQPYDDYDTHWQAAILALDAIAQDIDEDFHTILESPENQHHNRDDFFQLTYDVSKFVGNIISLEQFLGSSFNVSSRKLLVRGQSKRHVNDLFWVGDAEIPENIVGECGFYEPDSFGLADAFLSPPYGITGSSLELNTLFLEIAEHFFASFTDAGQIYSWSDDCSNYFDAGKEWWGTLFCTYFCRPDSTLVVVMASTTD